MKFAALFLQTSVLSFCLIASPFAPLSTTAKAADAPAAVGTKIGLVDMQKALQSVEMGKKAKAQLEKEFNAKKKDLQSEEAAIKKVGEEFRKQSMVLSDEARAKKQSEIQEKIMKFQEATQKAQMEIQQKEQDLTQPILGKIRALIGELAKKKGFNMILEKSENTVLFSEEKDDLTEEVISTFNKANGKS